MSNKDNVITLQMELTDIVNKVYNRIREIVSKYGDTDNGFPKLPEYEDIIKSKPLFYKYFNIYLEIGDEILCVMLEISMVHSSLIEIKREKLNKDLSNEYTIIQGFRKFLDESIERLSNSKFDLIELKRQATDRVKLLNNISYQ